MYSDSSVSNYSLLEMKIFPFLDWFYKFFLLLYVISTYFRLGRVVWVNNLSFIEFEGTGLLSGRQYSKGRFSLSFINNDHVHQVTDECGMGKREE